MKKSTIKSLTSVASSPYLSLYDAAYTNTVGTEKHWMIASRKTKETLANQFFEGLEEKTDAVVLVARHEETKKLALVRQFRIPLNDFVYELPAGLIDGEEALSVCATRELKEETGLEVTQIDNIQDKLYLSPGMTEESVALVFCRCKGIVSTAFLEEDEVIEPILISKKEAQALLESNQKIDIKAYLIMQQFVNDLIKP